MKFPAGKIIAFEGLDNCFKETNYKEFVNRLKSQCSNYENMIHTESFPRYGTQCCIGVEKWLDGSFDRHHMKAHPEAICNLYSLDRYSYWFESVHGMQRNIDKLHDGDCFIFDRYNVSNAIYQPQVGDMPRVDDLLYDDYAWGIPAPDIVIWLRIRNFAKYEELLETKQNKDLNESDIDFMKKIWDRSEYALFSDIFSKAGIDLRVIEILDDDGELKSKEQLAIDVYHAVRNAINGSVERFGKPIIF